MLPTKKTGQVVMAPLRELLITKDYENHVEILPKAPFAPKSSKL